MNERESLDAGGRATSTGWANPGMAVLAAFLGFSVGFPSVFSSTATVFILPLTHTFGWGRIVPSMMYVAGTGGLALSSIWLGRLIERLGAARVAAFSGVALAIVLALLGMQRGSSAEAIGLCFIAGVFGAGTGAGLWLGIPPAWFDAHLGRALGIAALGQSAGLAVLPVLASAVINARDWRAAYEVLACVALVVNLCAAAMVMWLSRRSAARVSPVIVQTPWGMQPKEAMRTARFWLLALAILLVSFGVVGTSIHLFPLYVDRGATAGKLPLIALALGIGTVIGRIGAGVALDHIEAKSVAVALFLLGAVGIAWLRMLHGTLSTLDVTGPPALVGLAVGAESDILAFLARRLFGIRRFSVIYNRLLIAFYVGAVSGASMLGWAADKLADAGTGLWGSAAACALGALAAGALPSTRPAKADVKRL